MDSIHKRYIYMTVPLSKAEETPLKRGGKSEINQNTRNLFCNGLFYK